MTTKSTPPSQPTQPVYIVAKDDVTLPVDGSANKREPEPIFGTQGWDEGLPFDCSTINYIFNSLGTWVKYLNDQRPFDLDSILKAIKDLSDKHDSEMQSMTERVNAMQIKVGGYYFGGATNPATHLLYGTWVKVEADVTLRSADQDGTATGNNTPDVPLARHKHTGRISETPSHTHPFSGTTSSDTHHHDSPISDSSGNTLRSIETGNPDSGTQGRLDTSSVTHNHTFSGTTGSGGAHTPTFTCDETGEASPTLDVRGKYIPCVIWKRTA